MNENAFLIIPYAIMSLEDLKISEKVVLAEIISLAKNKGYCYATNAFISKRTSTSLGNIPHIISKLQKKGYITIELKNRQNRKIYISKDKVSREILSLCNYSYSTIPLVDSDSPFVNSTNPFVNLTNNKKNNKTRNKKSNKRAHRSDASYDIEELMKIR